MDKDDYKGIKVYLSTLWVSYKTKIEIRWLLLTIEKSQAEKSATWKHKTIRLILPLFTKLPITTPFHNPVGY